LCFLSFSIGSVVSSEEKSETCLASNVDSRGITSVVAGSSVTGSSVTGSSVTGSSVVAGSSVTGSSVVAGSSVVVVSVDELSISVTEIETVAGRLVLSVKSDIV